jgi:hypothetical protein
LPGPAALRKEPSYFGLIASRTTFYSRRGVGAVGCATWGKLTPPLKSILRPETVSVVGEHFCRSFLLVSRFHLLCSCLIRSQRSPPRCPRLFGQSCEHHDTTACAKRDSIFVGRSVLPLPPGALRIANTPVGKVAPRGSDRHSASRGTTLARA